MKRKSIDDLFKDLHISLNNKKVKTKHKETELDKIYTQIEVDDLLKSQEEYLFNQFEIYIKYMRSTVDVNIPKWAC